MTRLAAVLLSLLLSMALSSAAHAQERILSYDSDVSVNTDGSLDVVERIRVRAEGTDIRRGIYRDFPTRYKDRRGNRVVVGFTVLGVQRNGNSEPWFTEHVGNGVRVNTGNDDLLPVPAEYTYTLRYRTTRQLGFFDTHDELYWNAIGTGWSFPIEAGSVRVRLPQAIEAERLQPEAYTGAQGMQGRDYASKVLAPGVVEWRPTRALAPNEGMTIVLGFPKGIVTAPTRAQRIGWLFKDNRGVLVALTALLGLLAFCVSRWRALGRDPRPGVVIARYDPPQGYSPAALRYIQKRAYDPRCLSSDLLALAVDGVLRIEREDRLLADDWQLIPLRTARDAGDAPLPGSQSALLSKLFKGNAPLKLKPSNAVHLQAVRTAQAQALQRAYDGRMFKRNGATIGIAIAIAFVGFVLAMLASGGAGIPLILLLGALMVVTVISFGVLVAAPTQEGRKLLDEIAGLKLYLGVAERDELARMPAPGDAPVLDSERYQRLLPYAVALEVEDAWTRKFTAAVGVAAATAAASGMAWYSGGGMDSLTNLTESIGSGLSAHIASASSPPGSSSGGGGGGSSGGGGGGGGGGGR